MIILTTVFSYKPFNYNILLNVFKKSCEKHMPNAKFVILEFYVPKAKDNRKPGLWTNTVKLREQVKYINNANDDVVIADCDMLCFKSFENVFKEDFDIGYTVKARIHKTSCRINGGIIFVKNTENAKAWMNELLKINEKMYYNEDFHNQWRCKYYGMNQSAMGYMSERYKGPAKVKEFSTLIYNACDCDWKNVKSNTKIVHIKGKLRECILKNKDHFHYSYIIKKWRQYHGAPIPVVKKRSKKTRRQRRRRAVMRIRRTK